MPLREFETPIRWAGSKRAILPLLASVAPPTFTRYVEPFAGSAALFFYLQPQHALLGDFNRDLISFYSILAEAPDSLARSVRRFAPDGSDYYRVRAMNPLRMSPLSAAARFLYLNRFCFNGVYRTNKHGRFNVPIGSRTGVLPTRARLRLASRQLSRATISRADFEWTLDSAQRGDFAYIDPPYFTRKGIRSGEYGKGSLSGIDDLTRLIESLESLTKRGVKYLLSYSDSPSLRRRLDPSWTRLVRVRRSVGGSADKRKTVREVLIANYRPSLAS